MIRNVAVRASSLFLSMSILVVAGCCHEQQLAVFPPIQNQEQKVAALDTQLKGAETTGWSAEDDRKFSGSMATLPMKVRIDYAHQLARKLTYGQIKVRPAAPPPDNAPVCACGGNSCGVTPTPAPTPVGTPPAGTVPTRGERTK